MITEAAGHWAQQLGLCTFWENEGGVWTFVDLPYVSPGLVS